MNTQLKITGKGARSIKLITSDDYNNYQHFKHSSNAGMTSMQPSAPISGKGKSSVRIPLRIKDSHLLH